jgi:two-component system, chemotaxis family, chemotaxis protein CheY
MNLQGLNFLVADPNAYSCMICQSILRSFGATKIAEARNTEGVNRVLVEQRIDLILCDALLPPDGGVNLARSLRQDSTSEYRTIPILILSNDTRMTTVRTARDYGVNMVVAKPVSISGLYDRLAWVAFYPRNFVNSPTYFGPDRRFKIEGYPTGVGRRAGDKEYSVAEDSGPQMDQSDIDSLLNIARKA